MLLRDTYQWVLRNPFILLWFIILGLTIKALFSFPPKILGKALKELLTLWVISSMPLLISILAKSTSKDTLSMLNPTVVQDVSKNSLLDIIASEVNMRALFLYTSAFLAPVLFLMLDRVVLVWPKKEPIFASAFWVFITTIVIFGLSCWAYQNDNLASSPWLPHCLCMYFLSIYFWFLSIADGRIDSFDYGQATSETENAFAKKASERHRQG